MTERSKEEIHKEWESVAQALFDVLKQDHTDAHALKRISEERKSVRSILLPLLIETGEEKFLEIVFDILKEDMPQYGLVKRRIACGLFYYFPFEKLQRFISPIVNEMVESGSTLDPSYRPTSYDEIFFWYGGVLLQSDTLTTEYRKAINNFKQNPESADFSIDDVVCSKVLGLDEELNSLDGLARKLIAAKRQEDRIIGLYLIAVEKDADNRQVISSILSDRASFVRESAEEFLQIIDRGYSIRAWCAGFLWDTCLIPPAYLSDDDENANNDFERDADEIESDRTNDSIDQIPIPEELIAWIARHHDKREARLIVAEEVNQPAAITREQPVILIGTSEAEREDFPHLHTQSKLVMLGIKQGFDVAVARDNRSRKVGDIDFTKLTIPVLPHLGGISEREKTIIDYIDVLWLSKRYLARAIEIEYSTTIYSGLLRLSDLVLSIPNLRVSVSIVLPQERVRKLQREIERPTFAHLRDAPLSYCTFEDIEGVYNEFSTGFWSKPTKAELLIPWKTI